MTRIFISYRRDDAGYVASIVRQHLELEFGAGSVFMDIDSIPLGVDFRQHLSDAVAGCDVLIALIGETWAGPQPGGLTRRLDDPRDFVRIEIETALKRGIPVVPVLIDKAQPPSDDALPTSLRELAFRNAAELRAGRDLQAHLQALSRGLHAHLGGGPGRSDGGAQASPVVAPNTAAPRAKGPVMGAATTAATAATDAASAATSAAPPAAASATPRAVPAAPVEAASTATPAPPPGARPGSSPTRFAIAAGAAGVVALGAWWASSRPDPAAAATAKLPPPVAPPTTVATAPATRPPTPDEIVAANPPGGGLVSATVPAVAGKASDPAPAGTPATAPAASLHGFTLAIYYPAGDTAAGITARQLKATLEARGVRARIELRLATARFLRDVVPPQSVELRYEPGSEDAVAQAVAAALAGVPARQMPRLVPVESATPRFLSLFVPPGG